ncbi:hypothetical protein LINPERHAP1_LOCUS32788, partial [Linum perenne]
MYARLVVQQHGYRVPLTILNWTFVDQTVKDGIWKEVKENLLNVPDEYEEVCLRSCNGLWKDHKGKTKSRYYKKRKHDPDLANKPPRGGTRIRKYPE